MNELVFQIKEGGLFCLNGCCGLLENWMTIDTKLHDMDGTLCSNIFGATDKIAVIFVLQKVPNFSHVKCLIFISFT